MACWCVSVISSGVYAIMRVNVCARMECCILWFRGAVVVSRSKGLVGHVSG